MGMRPPLPTIMSRGGKVGQREWRVPGFDVMCEDAPESMYQSEVLEGGGGDVCAARSAACSPPMSHGWGGTGAVLELAPGEP